MNALDQLAAAGRAIRNERLASERQDASRLYNMQRYGTEQERRTYAALTLLHASMVSDVDAYTSDACDLIASAAASLADGVEERTIHAPDDAETAAADRKHDERAS